MFRVAARLAFRAVAVVSSVALVAAGLSERRACRQRRRQMEASWLSLACQIVKAVGLVTPKASSRCPLFSLSQFNSPACPGHVRDDSRSSTGPAAKREALLAGRSRPPARVNCGHDSGTSPELASSSKVRSDSRR